MPVLGRRHRARRRIIDNRAGRARYQTVTSLCWPCRRGRRGRSGSSRVPRPSQQRAGADDATPTSVRTASPVAPDPVKTRKAASRNEPDRGTIGKSATFTTTVRRSFAHSADVAPVVEDRPPSPYLGFPPRGRWPKQSAEQSHRAASSPHARGLQRVRRRIGSHGGTLVRAKPRIGRGAQGRQSIRGGSPVSHSMGGGRSGVRIFDKSNDGCVIGWFPAVVQGHWGNGRGCLVPPIPGASAR
jgi:hypothetical protein